MPRHRPSRHDLLSGGGANGRLVLYRSVKEEWCRVISEAFERETGIDVLMTRRSSGGACAQIEAEGGQRRGDVWRGGTGNAHLQAAQENLTKPYKVAQAGETE